MKILVVGAGVMGHAIAEVCAISGFEVFLNDISEEILKNAIENIKLSLKELEGKGKIINSEEILARIKPTLNLKEAASEADVVIEAVSEKIEIKKKVFEDLDNYCKDKTIITSNTSSIPITKLASFTKRREKIAGLHFFNPPLLIRFLEIIKGEETSDSTIEFLKEFARKLGMDYVVVNKDVAGFIVNRLAIFTFIEAMKLSELGFSYEEIDFFAKRRLGYPMGIFELADFVGLDIIFDVLRQMKESGVNIEIPNKLLELVNQRRLGMKTGSGFYEYGFRTKRKKVDPSKIYGINPLRILAPSINEAAWLIRNQVANAESIDKAMEKGLNIPKGPLKFADEIGLDKVYETLKALRKESDAYQLDPLISDMVSKQRLGVKTGEGFYKWKHEIIDFGKVRYEKRNDYALITMRRAEKLNALNEEMWISLRNAFRKAVEDKEVRAVIITGEGRAFSSGDDISMMGKWKTMLEGKEFFEKIVSPFVIELLNYEKPIISLVNGFAFGGGCELNLFFDIVIASEDSSFALPEGLIGAMPPIASTLGLFVLGRRIQRLCFTGEQISAEEAKEFGLVDLVVPRDQLEIVGLEFVEKLRRLAPLSARAIKRSMNSVKSLIMNSLMISAEELSSLVASEDFKEGMEAFLSRRNPIWRGS